MAAGRWAVIDMGVIKHSVITREAIIEVVYCERYEPSAVAFTTKL
jgi:hypothetical protein